MRISCAAFIRLTIGKRFALLIDDGSTKMLSPIGGIIKTTPRGREQLQKRFGVFPQHYKREAGELSFLIRPLLIPAFRNWFNRGDELESDPAGREFREELGSEEHGLLADCDAARVSFSFLGCREYSYIRQRPGRQPVVFGLGFFHIYNAEVPRDVLRQLLLQQRVPDCPLRFVTAEEIRQGYTDKELPIADVCKLLL